MYIYLTKYLTTTKEAVMNSEVEYGRIIRGTKKFKYFGIYTSGAIEAGPGVRLNGRTSQKLE